MKHLTYEQKKKIAETLVTALLTCAAIAFGFTSCKQMNDHVGLLPKSDDRRPNSIRLRDGSDVRTIYNTSMYLISVERFLKSFFYIVS